ncbi:3-oxoacyl-ACP reductase [Hahella sp. CCB-MM4]|uniref:SDR family oxidoreductase n=1 Tax=Hahella sp. (strain CCB-MM4) TaxID=1926491 RepID=UPI000B9B3E70|nr:SDR family oxidoreductase [Hahella sp. CCB-MM4]OZG70754.1 3-oxoacyl-ACP reductase [Hahella sp. CCB-MM4]
MDMGLQGKTVMVAAASSGLGLAIARQCAREGANLSIMSRSQEKIHAAAESIRQETGVTVLAQAVDALDPEGIQVWFDKTVRDLGTPDAVLVNAGGPPAGQFDDFDDVAWQAAFDLTLMSSVRMIRCALPHMRKAGRGSIVVITSSSVKEPIDMLLLSNVMRTGVTSLVKSLSRQYAGEGVRLNTIIPGRIDTPRVQALDITAAGKKGISVETQKTASEGGIPLGRYGDPQEFARAACFLLSEASSYITGTALVVDGGSMKSLF